MSTSHPSTIQARQFGVQINRKVILNDITFSVKGPGSVALVGPSGGGKSTIASALTRLHESYPSQWKTTGYLAVDGLSVADWDPIALRRRVGLSLQTPVALPHSIADNLVTPQRLVLGMGRQSAEHRALESLAEFGLAETTLQASAQALSGGQQQRLAMARAMLLEPGILILDEPTSALDPPAAARVAQLLMRMSRTTLLLVITHDINLARVCDRVLFLRQGASGSTLSADAQPDKVLDDSRNELEYQFAHASYRDVTVR